MVRSDEGALENSPLTVTATGDGHTETWSSSLTAAAHNYMKTSYYLDNTLERDVTGMPL